MSQRGAAPLGQEMVAHAARVRGRIHPAEHLAGVLRLRGVLDANVVPLSKAGVYVAKHAEDRPDFLCEIIMQGGQTSIV